MGINFRDLFPKNTVNEPALQLNDPRWAELEGGYHGTTYDASTALKKLEQADSLEEVREIYEELWNELHHQGDVGVASYYAVPHMVRIAEEKGLLDSNVLGLVSLIEIQRHKKNPAIPSALYPAYSNSISELLQLATPMLAQNWDSGTASAVLMAVAVAKGHIKLGNAIQNLDDEDVIDEFLENHS